MMDKAPIPTLHVEPLFATPLVMETVLDNDVDRAAVVAAILAAAEAGGKRPGRNWSGTTGIRNEALRKLVGYIGDAAGRRTADIRHPQRPVAWKTRAGGHVAFQDEHLDIVPSYDAFWSALYVADDGYAGSRNPDAGGELIFHDPRLPAPMMELPELRLRTDMGRKNAVYTPEIAVRPATGYLLLYPGWLRVSMRTLRAAGPRVVVGVSLVAPLDTDR